jgi:hypothetical protein
MFYILKRGIACRLALIDGDKPYITAMNYGFCRDDLYPTHFSHSAKTRRKIDIIKNNAASCFMIDIDQELIKNDII